MRRGRPLSVKKLLLHVPLAAMLCLGAATPATAQGTITTDRTPAAGSTINVPDTAVPYGWNDPRFVPRGTSGLDGTTSNRYGANGFINGYRNGFGTGMTGNGMRGLGSYRNNPGMYNNDGSVVDRLDEGITDVNRAARRTANNMRVRATAADNDGTNWGWLGLLGLIGLAGMFRAGDRERDRA